MNGKITESDAVRRELTMKQIIALPGFIGKIATGQCKAHGEYKYREIQKDGTEVKTHIVLVA